MSVVTGWQFSGPVCLAREATARLFGPLFSFYLRGPRVEGAKHLDAINGPTLICPTHASHFDSSALRLALGPRHRRRLAPAVAADYFSASRLRWFLAAWLGSFLFERGARGKRASLEMAHDLLAAGWHVLVFPEGTRSMTGEIGPFRPGAAFIASESGVPILPVRIRGTAAVLPKGASVPHRAPVTVTFGPLLWPEPGEDARQLTARLEAAVRSL
jgi:1-acyl-sn-glycerol-3-phosphate acyltransferase